MRKLAYFLIALVVIGLVWSLVAWFYEPVKIGTENLFKMIGGKAWAVISDAGNRLRINVSATGTAFLAYSLVILVICGGVFWLAMVKLWAHRPGWLHKPSVPRLGGSSSSSATAGGSTMQSQTPADATLRPNPETATKQAEATAPAESEATVTTEEESVTSE